MRMVRILILDLTWVMAAPRIISVKDLLSITYVKPMLFAPVLHICHTTYRGLTWVYTSESY